VNSRPLLSLNIGLFTVKAHKNTFSDTEGANTTYVDLRGRFAAGRAWKREGWKKRKGKRESEWLAHREKQVVKEF